MREILFRGKSAYTGKWVYSSPMVDNVDFSGTVKPYTLGQYTGLQDKNGKKIFEGDILRYGDGLPHRVIFENDSQNAYFGIVMDEYAEVWKFCPSVPASEMEVVGNIYDNPELLD